MSRIKNKPAKVPGAFSANVFKTERATVAVLAHWMRNIIVESNLDLGPPDVDTGADDRKSPDIVIYESHRSQNALCIIEAKLPHADVYNEQELIVPAYTKAQSRGAKYFAVTNFRDLIWFDTAKVRISAPETDQVINEYNLSKLEDVNKIEQARYKEPIQKALLTFLSELYKYHSGKEAAPKLPIDERLIRRIHAKIQRLAKYYSAIIEDRANKDRRKFGRDLSRWANKQGWDFQFRESDYERAARQTAYLLSNKIMFYMALQAKRPHELDPIEIPASLTKGDLLRSNLEAHFSRVLNKIDYEEIFEAEFIDQEAFPDAEEVVAEIKALVNILQRYNFAKLQYDIIGRIFEKLIPLDERHNLGQYFTNSDVVDLILRFCHHHEDQKVLDPSCGAGTFLVRAYQHKKVMNPRKPHEEILATLWGNDIAKFPASLTSINLAIRDLGVDKNYPNILHKDFFDIYVGKEGCDLDSWRKMRAKTLRKSEVEITYPRYFDVIVGNPPYTRQEELQHISQEYGKKKVNLITHSLLDLNGSHLANLTKRAGIHAYFFVHGWKFLREGGHFGFIVSNSWLDVDYGKGLQEFFLKNYKIVCIIESKVERWFADADVNTCIVILQKCKDEQERDANLCRFVHLKKRLSEMIPPAEESLDNQKYRFHQIDLLKQTILNHDDFYENDDMRIFPISQVELWKEGYDEEEGVYAGAKWGKYLRAPKIYFSILEKGKGKLGLFKDVAKVRFGIKTGANEFFYLTEKQIEHKRIEKEFWKHKDESGNFVPNFIVKSPRECKSIMLDPKKLKYRVLMIHKDKRRLKGTNILKHIARGEVKKFNKRPTCASRGTWYDLGIWEKPDFIWSDAYNDRYGVYDTGQTWADKRFFFINTNEENFKLPLLAYLNCTIIPLMIEIDGITNLGEGAIYTNVYQLKRLPVMANPSQEIRRKLKAQLDILSKRDILSIFLELGGQYSNQVNLENVKSDRRELDRIIMGDILGLTDEEQLEVYQAVVDLVRSRLDKAKSVNNETGEDQEEMHLEADSMLTDFKNSGKGS